MLETIKRITSQSLVLFALASVPSACFVKQMIKKATSTPEKKKSKEDSLRHPEKPNAWATQALLATSKLPSEEEILLCSDELDENAKLIKNEGDLLATASRLELPVAEDSKLYHWCFYIRVRTLDDNLREQSSFQEKSRYFHEAMKPLWALAQALDKATRSNVYSIYLRDRYIDISKTHFGRQVEPSPRKGVKATDDLTLRD